MFRKGSTLLRLPVAAAGGPADGGEGAAEGAAGGEGAADAGGGRRGKRAAKIKRREIGVLHDDIIGPAFWAANADLFPPD